MRWGRHRLETDVCVAGHQSADPEVIQSYVKRVSSMASVMMPTELVRSYTFNGFLEKRCLKLEIRATNVFNKCLFLQQQVLTEGQ